MRAWTSVLAAVAGLSLAAPVAAQLPERGAWSLELSPAGDAQIGVWKMRSERTNLGVDFGLRLDRTDHAGSGPIGERTFLGLIVAPSIKRYGTPVGPFAPYLFGSVPFGVEQKEIGGSSAWWMVGGSLAAGLDWFPVRNVSVGGRAGILASYRDSSAQSVTDVGTFSSGLSLHFYF